MQAKFFAQCWPKQISRQVTTIGRHNGIPNEPIEVAKEFNQLLSPLPRIAEMSVKAANDLMKRVEGTRCPQLTWVSGFLSVETVTVRARAA